jgi:hypothetical protein
MRPGKRVPGARNQLLLFALYSLEPQTLPPAEEFNIVPPSQWMFLPIRGHELNRAVFLPPRVRLTPRF